jgi:para-aminobenzoate synthetase component 1
MSSKSHPILTAVHVRELSAALDPLAVLASLRGQSYPWLLDSALASPRLGCFCFAGADPYLVVRSSVTSGKSVLECRRRVRCDLEVGSRVSSEDPFELVRRLLPAPPSGYSGSDASELPWIGGAVGYWGYELAEKLETIRFSGRDDLGMPDLALLFVDRLLAIDQKEGRAWAVGLGFASERAEAAARAEHAASSLSGIPTERGRSRLADEEPRASAQRRWPVPPPGDLRAFFDESSYGAAVRRIAREIAQGNVYQANLTHRLELPLGRCGPMRLYRELRRLNPAPFAAYLELPEGAILSSSPERFLKLGQRRDVESRPIKGTRPRGRTPESDLRLEQELSTSEKDRAENLMIVDLVRNDLGRVCELGSIEVPELQVIERYATVLQMVSTVTGRLRGDRDAIDLLRACFPPGSMTGAPKIAAMQLLDEIEPVKRGVYSGALGYLDVRGGLDLSVVIRALIVQRGRAVLHVGGGIVADSEPVAEYRETLDKARALIAAVVATRASETATAVPASYDSARVW